MVGLKRVLKGVLTVVGLVLLAVFSFLWWGSGGETEAATVQGAPVIVLDNGTEPSPDTLSLAAITFNIGYARGPEGDEAGPWSLAHFERHLDGIAQQIADSGADVAALQEVDLGAARSHGIDQGRYLAEKLGWNWVACVVTWENNHVPYPYWPPTRHYGAMKSGQCVLSRLPISWSMRHRLPQPAANAWWRNLFYLNRAVQHVVIALDERRTLDVYNVHLEAFDRTNRERHMRQLAALVDANPSERVLVLGDFNAPPADGPAHTGFPDEPQADFTGDTTVALASAMAGVTEVLLGKDPALTFPADGPSRRLDYIFHRGGLSLASARVLTDAPVWSDHLPIIAAFSVKR